MKIKEEQLTRIQKQQRDLNTLITNVGYLEIQKHNNLHQISELNRDIDSYKGELENEYGSININVETGDYTIIEKEKEKEPNLKVVENA